MAQDEDLLHSTVRALRPACTALPGAEEYVMVHHPAFRVGKKPFLIVGMESAAKGVTFSVNLGHDMQPALLADSRFSRTPYIGQHGWVTIAQTALRKGELDALVVGSWERVATKTQRAQRVGKPAVTAKKEDVAKHPRRTE